MISIRKLDESDNQDYCELWSHAITRHADCFRISPCDEATRFIPTRFADDSFTLGAFATSRLMGVVSAERDSRTKMNHKALVFRMFVHPDAAGQGAGRALLHQVISDMSQVDGIRYLYLTVLASNLRAIHLYSSVGFTQFACEAEAVRINDQFVDELQMARRL